MGRRADGGCGAGLVVVVTACDWDPEVLDESLWLGGAPVPVPGAVDPRAAPPPNGNSSNGDGAHGNGSNGATGANGGNGANGNGANGNGANGSNGANGNGSNGANGSNGNGARGNGNGNGGGVPAVVHARQAIERVLGGEFEFVSAADVPRVSMEHCRKFTLQCIHVLAWKFVPEQQ